MAGSHWNGEAEAEALRGVGSFNEGGLELASGLAG